MMMNYYKISKTKLINRIKGLEEEIRTLKYAYRFNYVDTLSNMEDGFTLMSPKKNDYRYIVVDISHFSEDNISGVIDQLNAVEFGYLDIGDL